MLVQSRSVCAGVGFEKILIFAFIINMAEPRNVEMLLRYRSSKPLQPRKMSVALVGQSKAAIQKKLGSVFKMVSCKLPRVDYDVKKHVWSELDGRLYMMCESETFVSSDMNTSYLVAPRENSKSNR